MFSSFFKPFDIFCILCCSWQFIPSIGTQVYSFFFIYYTFFFWLSNGITFTSTHNKILGEQCLWNKISNSFWDHMIWFGSDTNTEINESCSWLRLGINSSVQISLENPRLGHASIIWVTCCSYAFLSVLFKILIVLIRHTFMIQQGTFKWWCFPYCFSPGRISFLSIESYATTRSLITIVNMFSIF